MELNGFKDEEILGIARLPEDVFHCGDNCFLMTLTGCNMSVAGIYNGDTLFFDAKAVAKNGDIVYAVLENGEGLCRRYFKKGKKVVLRREDNETPDQVVKNCQIRGVLIGYYRKIRAQAV